MHSAISVPSGRRGQGTLLLLVVVVLALLIVMGIYQRFFASHLTSRTSQSEAGSTAVMLADSAVQEALWLFETQVNDPSSPLFQLLRQEVYSSQTGELDLTGRLDLEELPALLAKDRYDGYSLDDYEARVVYQRQFEDLPYERFGQVLFRARVSGRPAGGPPIVREVEIAKGFKVVLAVVPRPFDQAALFLGDLDSATDLKEVEALRRRFVEETRQVARSLRTARDRAPPALQARYDEMLTALGPPEKVEASVPPLDIQPGSALFGVWQEGQQYPLESLDLAARLRRDDAALAVPRQTFSAAARSAAGSASQAGHESALAAAQELLRGLDAALSRIWAFDEGFQVVDSTTPGFDDVAAQQARLGLDHWRRVAFFTLREGQGEGSVGDQLAALRRRIDPLNGIVLVENPDRPLVLTGKVRGRLVVVVTRGGAVLDGVNGEAGEGGGENLLTLVSLGGPVQLSGNVDAYVALAGGGENADGSTSPGTFVMNEGARLHGGLYLARVMPGSRLEGRLIRGSRYYSGMTGEGSSMQPRLDRYVIGVSPTTTYRRIRRR